MISVEQASNTAQKRSNNLSEKSSSKKQKTSNKEGIPFMLKKLIEELLTDNSNNEDLEESTEGASDASLNSGNFFHLSSMIDQAKKKIKMQHRMSSIDILTLERLYTCDIRN